MLLSVYSFTGIDGAVGKSGRTCKCIDSIIFFDSFVRLHLCVVLNSHLALLRHIVDLKLTSSFVDVSDSSVVVITACISLLDGNLLFVLFSLGDAVTCTIAHSF